MNIREGRRWEEFGVAMLNAAEIAVAGPDESRARHGRRGIFSFCRAALRGHAAPPGLLSDFTQTKTS